ncbi:MAG: GntR family transcriptional regulator [Kiritimatiellae bacterium]|nr:GntR family transcriptional regulator [Kiritimatiellia bacterium]MDD4736495.1 GntR family transcriptional regulator [Kiritimatiellia bacterium]
MTNSENQKQGGLSRDERDRKYLYRQLADIIQKEIGDGKYIPGDRLPSMDSLAAQYQVTKVTVRRALSELTNEGLIYAIPAQGTYIADPASAKPAPKPKSFMTIGLLSQILIPGNTGQYHLDIIEGMREELELNHANLVIMPGKYVQPTTKLLDLITQSHLDGIILLGHFDPQLLRYILTAPVPAVLLDHSLRGASVDTILIDNRDGGFQAMDRLLSLRHERVAVVTGPLDQIVVQERLAGIYDAADEHGVPHDSIQLIESNFVREAGYDAMCELLKQTPRPTAVFLMNDEMAAGAMQAINMYSGLSVPSDISIIGFDDTSLAQATHPPLTTIQIPRLFMGRLAVQRIVSRLEQPGQRCTTTTVPVKLISRASTASAPEI